jgi:ribosomal protein L24E
MASLCLPGLQIKRDAFIYYLNSNNSENAIKYLIQNPDYIEWFSLSSNPYAVDLLVKNQDKICWKFFCKNPNPAIMDILLKNPTKIHWETLSSNPVAIDLLLQNQDKINWAKLSTNPAAIELLTQNKDKINYDALRNNPNAYELIKEYIETQFISEPSLNNFMNERNKLLYIKELSFNKNEELLRYLYKHHSQYIDWNYLNTNPVAIDILLENMDKINFYQFSLNPHPKAVELLKQYPHRIDWENFSAHITDYALIAQHNPILKDFIWTNPIIFDYKAISKYKMDIIKEELMQKVLHPKRIERWLEQGLDMDDL